MTQLQVNAFLPQRGPFTFPAPYNTRGIRITNATDCGGQDCVFPIGYSYWRNTNYHVHDDEMLVFLGMNDRRGGGGPTLFRVNKKTGQVTNAGPLFPPNSRFSAASGEMWYFSPSLPNMLYIRDGAKLVRYDVIQRTFETVFDATTHFGSGHFIWQMHTSNNDRVHSATLRRSTDYAELGCFVYFEDSGEFRFFARKGSYDECQIDRSGRYLVIKENVTGRYGADNRFIDLKTGTERLLIDEDGAGGHSDMGYGVMIAADNWSSPNAMRRWDFTHPTLDGTEVYRGNHWTAPAPNHVSFTHARPDVPLDEQYVCGSAASTRNDVHTNEIICFLLARGSHTRTLVVAPVMTNMAALGGGDSYNKLPKGNLDVTGQYFIWTSNMGGNRIDAFIVKVPAQKLYQ
jgi:hypothetical protein